MHFKNFTKKTELKHFEKRVFMIELLYEKNSYCLCKKVTACLKKGIVALSLRKMFQKSF